MVEVGGCYRMPARMNDVRVVQIAERGDPPITWVRLENLSGRRIGQCRWETMKYFASVEPVRMRDPQTLS